MDLLNSETVTIKIEPGTEVEDGNELPHTDVEIHIPEIKKENLDIGDDPLDLKKLNYSTTGKKDTKYIKFRKIRWKSVSQKPCSLTTEFYDQIEL